MRTILVSEISMTDLKNVLTVIKILRSLSLLFRRDLLCHFEIPFRDHGVSNVAEYRKCQNNNSGKSRL